MSDIVLVYPKTGFDIKGVSIDPPLSLLAISSIVIDSYNVKIVDQRIDKNWKQTLIKELASEPLCVGVTSMTGPQIGYALEVSQLIKDTNPSTKVVWGGVHATLLPEQTLLNATVDIVVIGEGEVTFRELIDALSNKNDLKKVEGLAIKDGDGITITKHRECADLNNLPEIPYDLVDIEEYIGSQGRFKGASTRSLIFISSRGCPWGCTYCCNPRLSKRRWRALSAEKTYHRISRLVQKYKLDAITFHDEEFLVDQERAKRIAEQINGKFRWWIQARMDRLKLANLRFLCDTGLSSVQPGIESGSDRILNMIKKGETVSDILEANKKLSETNIIPLYNFMMGFPTETTDELMQTVDLALRLLEENPNAQISGFYTLIPYPGTEMLDLAKKEGFRTPNSLEEWASYNRQHLNTPWLQERIHIFKSLMVTSKFIDGTRLKNRIDDSFGGIDSLPAIYNYLARIYRYRWKNRIFKPSFDRFINKIVLLLFHISQKNTLRKIFAFLINGRAHDTT